MSRNPFGVQDVPDPSGEDVTAFASSVRLTGVGRRRQRRGLGRAVRRSAGVARRELVEPLERRRPRLAEGPWQAPRRWNRVYILFDWDDATKHGLIEARWDGRNRLIGRYLNLSAPEITRPWVGLIVDATRVDGEHSGGRIDFRR